MIYSNYSNNQPRGCTCAGGAVILNISYSILKVCLSNGVRLTRLFACYLLNKR